MKTIKVICEECKKEFEKLKHHYNYAQKMNRLHFCSRSCWSKFTQRNLTDLQKEIRFQRIKGHHYDSTDQFSPFRQYLKGAQMGFKRKKLGDIPNIDLEYLKQLWETQKGVCPYTGIQMELGNNINGFRRIRSLKKASLDRIDSTKGYLKGNLEFVCLAINLAKNSFTREEMKEFLKEVVEPKGVEPL